MPGDEGRGKGGRRTAGRGGVALGGPTGDCSGWLDVAAYFTGNQDRRNVFVDGRSGPDRVPGNLFPAREIYFPGINIPTLKDFQGPARALPRVVQEHYAM